MKNLLTMALIGLLFSGAVFAKGQVDERYYTDTDSRLETFAGKLDVDGQFPVLETTDGKMYYLRIPAPVDPDTVPELGDTLEIQGVRSFRNPNVIMVESGTVNGTDVVFQDSPWHFRDFRMDGFGGHPHDWPREENRGWNKGRKNLRSRH